MPIDIPAGTVIGGDFRIVRPLKAGGMGAVFVAEQISTGMQRALKVMLPALVDDPSLRERFTREAQVGSQIDSEHVVQVVGAGVDAHGPWLAMELLRGRDLEGMVAASGPLPAPRVRAIMKQLCHAIGAAHDAGVVHRDLKPENVFLAESRRAESDFTVKVLDFGIAKFVDSAKTAGTTASIGSPMWMAPEQTAQHGKIGPQTDVWALGLIVFHLLCGKSFWRTPEQPDATVATLMREAFVDPMTTASARAAELGAALPDGFDAWFERAVNRDVARRFPNARAAHEALDRVLSGASPIAEASTDDAPPRATRAPLALVAAVVVIGAGALVWKLSSHTTASTASAPVSSSAPAGSSPPVIVAPDESITGHMLELPSGTLAMGSASGDKDEVPVHDVAIAPFRLDEREVTVSAFLRCAKAGACKAPRTTVARPPFFDDMDVADTQASRYCNASRSDRGDHPINCVDWTDADAFCRWAGKRLATEAEWEYAARIDHRRAVTNRLFPWGDDAPSATLVDACGGECVPMLLREQLALAEEGPKPLYADDGFETTAPVGSFPRGATDRGFADLSGNVREWTGDWYGLYGAESDQKKRATRGGSWMTWDKRQLRTTRRGKDYPVTRDLDLGFRCARSL